MSAPSPGPRRTDFRLAEDEARTDGLPPVVGEGARVLILGSMPGERSLRLGQYYAGPGNRFWRLVQDVLGVEAALPYEDRLRRLTGAGVALWDVLARCTRPGSLDASIVRGSETANDLEAFLATHAEIELIGLNGKAAARAYGRLMGEAPDRGRNVRRIELPSTSGANARWTHARLRERWEGVLGHERSG